MTKIIGHRGAAGQKLENTREALRAALAANVDAVEFDVRRTADDKLVLSHDPTTGRVSDHTVSIRDLTLSELRTVRLLNGETLTTIDEALEILGTTPAIIELKDNGSVDELLLALERHPRARISIASFLHDELLRVRQALPDIPIYTLEHFGPLEIVAFARHIHARGIGLNAWLMNPLTYHLAKRYGLELYVYRANAPLVVRFLRWLYPTIDLCVDHPARFTQPKRRRLVRKTAAAGK